MTSSDAMKQLPLPRPRTPSLASVIIPIFNHARFAVSTIRSAVEQTYREIEVIVVDDGSTDDGVERVKAAFPHGIRIVQQANRGPSAAINAGLAVANGEYIVLLGGDDVCMPERIEHQIALLGQTNSDVVFCRPMIINDEGERMPDSDAAIFFRPDLKAEISLSQLFFEENFLCAPSATLRASLFDRHGWMHEGLIQLQDFEFWLRICAHGARLRLFDRPVVQYRRHQSNLSTASRDAAANAETPVALMRMLREGDPRILRRAFQSLLPLLVDDCVPLSDFEMALILLAHPRRSVHDRGMALIAALLDDREFMSSPTGRRLNLFRFAYNSAV
jgi:GT2 family glycosyltransferase